MARQRLGDWVEAHPDARELADAKLLASELVTNAFTHGHGRIEIHAELDENHLMVEVIDQGKGFAQIVREQHFDRVGDTGSTSSTRSPAAGESLWEQPHVLRARAARPA